MDLRRFVETHGLRTKREEDGTAVVLGKHGHLYEHDSAQFGLVLFDLTARMWNHRKRACLAVGMELYLDGDAEGVLLFDATNEEQVEAALDAVTVRKRRRLSAEHRKRLIEAGATHRFQPHTGPDRPPSDSNGQGRARMGSGKGVHPQGKNPPCSGTFSGEAA
jgi:hypothetical protein